MTRDAVEMKDLRGKVVVATLASIGTVGGMTLKDRLLLEHRETVAYERILSLDTRLVEMERSGVRRVELAELEHGLDTRLRDLSHDVRDIKRLLMQAHNNR